VRKNVHTVQKVKRVKTEKKSKSETEQKKMEKEKEKKEEPYIPGPAKCAPHVGVAPV
jgi:hypothetical protein